MIVVAGKVSGIHEFLFATNEAGGGQAKRLRARSFIISLLAEVASLRVMQALGWQPGTCKVLMRAAGKFLLSGEPPSDLSRCLDQERGHISAWLLTHTNGELHFTLAVGESTTDERDAYKSAHEQLHAEKARPWAPPSERWDPTKLVLAPLETPCALCRRAPAVDEERDQDTGELRSVCHWCGVTRKLGHHLPSGTWLAIADRVDSGAFDLLGWGVTLHRNAPTVDGSVLGIVNLKHHDRRPDWCPPERFLERRLMAHVPVGNDGSPLEFVEIANLSHGDKLLGVLMADADSLGVAFEASLKGNRGLAAVTDLSHSLDDFFGRQLRTELERANGKWNMIYTVFAGGDDLVMVGPWDVMFEFAAALREWFTARFGNTSLTISCGLSIIKPKRPIRSAVAEAERLLEAAKTLAEHDGQSPKDQCCAFGQVWKWEHHRSILETALKLVRWIDTGQIERGWLHVMLGLVETRHPSSLFESPRRVPDPLATARVAHQVTRNYRSGSEARRWAENIVRNFDDSSRPEIRLLPVALRYALTATRTSSEMEYQHESW